MKTENKKNMEKKFIFVKMKIKKISQIFNPTLL